MKTNIQRVHTIDGIRGISLFGILLANLLIFQYGIWGKDELTLFDVSGFDDWMYAVTKIGVEGSFMPIFTFLFGYSMIMMRDSLERRQLRIKWHLFRRALLLMGFGVIHSIFLWEGDILFVYGMMSVFLMMFVNRKVKTMFIWGIGLFLLFSLTVLIPDDGAELYNQKDMNAYVAESADVYANGSYSAIMEHRNMAEDPMFSKLGDGELFAILFITPLALAPMFLFGMYAAKRKRFMQPANERKGYLMMAGLGFAIGLGMKSYGFFAGHEGFLMLGGMMLAFGYIGLIGLLYSNGTFGKALHCFENVGQLSLTNYIMQTVICTFIFYGYGFGQFGKMGVGWGLLLGILIFGMQMAFSSLYLEHFRYGPLEKIMRIGTYLKLRKPAEKGKQEAA